jgi:hypothetical protein
VEFKKGEKRMTGTNLIPADILTMLSQFGADLQVTVIALVVMAVPIGLAIWGVKFGAFKGIGLLKKQSRG